MDVLLRSLRTIAIALEAALTLAETIALFERDLRRALGAERVTIELGARPDAAAQDELPFELRFDGESLGRIRFAFDGRPAPEWEQLHALVAPISAALALRSQSGERRRLNDLVRTDALTCLANRMAFDEYVDGAWRRASARASTLTIALFDIDYFKAYNDLYGHLAGDDCLRAAAAEIAGTARAHDDFIARYGGEEFAYVSETLDEPLVAGAIERFVNAFAERPIPHEGTTLRRLSISAGVVSGVPAAPGRPADFLREADRSLYRAKALGRNRLCHGNYVSDGPVASRLARSSFRAPPFESEAIGREADITQVLAALRQSRMLSLVGPPEVGKSRLVRAAARAARTVATGGVAYVDLSLATEGHDPAVLVGAALDLNASGSAELYDALAGAVREPGTLLVLDNVRTPVAGAAADLCERLLRLAPGLTLLVTSRAALGCSDERVMVVARAPQLGTAGRFATVDGRI